MKIMLGYNLIMTPGDILQALKWEGCYIHEKYNVQ